MPAIKLTELKTRSSHLAQFYDQPAAFVRALHLLLDDYSERAYRSGQSGTPPPLISTYNVPFPVLRHIQSELVPRIQGDLENALKLADALWDQPYFEFRIMAAQLLGQLPTHHPEQIVERVKLWTQNETDNRLLSSLLKDALAAIQRNRKDVLLNIIKTWLDSEDTFNNQLGLRSANQLLADQDFEDVPYILKLLTPYIRSSPTQLHPEIIDIIRTLANRTPKEMVYYLRQNLEAPNSPTTALLIRQSLSFFPPELQDHLRSSIRGLYPPED